MIGSLAIALTLGVYAAPATTAEDSRVAGPVSGCDDIVSGRVVDDTTGSPVEGAVVRLGDVEAETDAAGRFELPGVCSGAHALTVTRTGYQTVAYDMSVDGDTAIDVRAQPQEIDFDDQVLVQVSEAEVTETRASTTLEGEALARTRGKTFADSIATVSGVTVLRSGGGRLGKPVIRGQYGRRVLLLNDGMPHAGQSWGIDHPPEVDPFSAGSITVIKGAGSIRYGTGAVGGVVLVDPKPLPRAPGITGEAHLVGSRQGREGIAAARIDGAHRWLPGFAWRMEGNVSRAAALLTPDYPLDNTGSLLWNVGATAGYQGDAFEVRLTYRRNFIKAGLCTCLNNETVEAFEQSLGLGAPVGSELYTSEYPIERAYHRVVHNMGLARGRVALGRAGELRVSYAFQDNDRKEFALVRDTVMGPQLDFELRTHSGDAAFEHAPLRLSDVVSLEGTTGVTTGYQTNLFISNQTLIPDYTQVSGGVFLLERVVTEPFEMQWGVRYDGLSRTSTLEENDYISQRGTGRLDEDDCTVLSNERARCRFPLAAASGSYGVLVRPTDDAELRLDLSSAARFPSVDEHFLNGGAPSFPALGLGDPHLGVERTWGSSLTLNTTSRWLSTETSVFLNYVDDYINFTPQISDGELGLNETIRGPKPVFEFLATDAAFYGAEFAFRAEPPRSPVSFDGQLSAMRGFDLDSPGYLVFIPPGRYRLGATYRWPEGRRQRNGYVSVIGTYFDRQRRYSPTADFAPPPPAYFLLGAAAGLSFPLGDQVLAVGLEGNNLTNARYRRYTSLLRYFADEPGWDVRLRLSLEFSIEGPGGRDPEE